ncbi:FAD-binding oxidoreductase [Roseisalinus antarcticus]|uniref:Putative decaprenylphosphoryl-beta-D-ribose oxidase n=1 Tax=Roseisalinus antarcticus TaxID=254357 RepID=A0A1Y5TV93_9RHOB|nr:FAD-binding oxidoreductase [Roseisalinus antarcticus]SLN70527.1 putative decaprenylphosphoryl-beta-D-ribose oxidase [Roseisalinus antarcticus]
MRLSGWGNFPVHTAEVSAPDGEAALVSALQKGPLIARGNGRAYGDSAVNRLNTVQMRRFDRMLSFDADSGLLVAEAGVLLGDVIEAFLPLGWFPAVTPGTKFVTLGGMVAADVHGKNHHKVGSFRSCVSWLDLMGADGQVRRCAPDRHAELFDWTLGGMGLTGIVLRVAIRLTPVETAWIRQETRIAANLDAAMDLFEASHDATYSVAWIDCLSGGAQRGRSIVMLGEHATLADLDRKQARAPLSVPRKRPKSVPLTPPAGLLNGLTVRAFNALYYRNGQRNAGTRLVDWDSYFYPLDAILGWNRIYGRKGFMQFQCALPLERSREGLTALLKAISAAGAGSFLAVLKRFGPQDGRFSFPVPGYTLALDFPVTARTRRLMERLDGITIAHGGRFYLAKDSRMSAETLRLSDPRAEAFAQARKDFAARESFASLQSERLAI